MTQVDGEGQHEGTDATKRWRRRQESAQHLLFSDSGRTRRRREMGSGARSGLDDLSSTAAKFAQVTRTQDQDPRPRPSETKNPRPQVHRRTTPPSKKKKEGSVLSEETRQKDYYRAPCFA